MDPYSTISTVLTSCPLVHGETISVWKVGDLLPVKYLQSVWKTNKTHNNRKNIFQFQMEMSLCRRRKVKHTFYCWETGMLWKFLLSKIPFLALSDSKCSFELNICALTKAAGLEQSEYFWNPSEEWQRMSDPYTSKSGSYWIVNAMKIIYLCILQSLSVHIVLCYLGASLGNRNRTTKQSYSLTWTIIDMLF